MKERFEKLITALCTLTNLDDPSRIINGGPIEVDDVVFSLIYNKNIDPDKFFVYADFGYAPAKNEASIYYALLKQNYITFAGKGPAFTISPATGSVVYVEHFHLDRTTADELASAMAYLAAKAKEWRVTHFLDTPSSNSAARRPRALQLHV